MLTLKPHPLDKVYSFDELFQSLHYFAVLYCVLSGSACVGGVSGGRSPLLLSTSSHSGWSSAICFAVSGFLQESALRFGVSILCCVEVYVCIDDWS